MIKYSRFTGFASIMLLTLFFASCRSSKYLDNDQALVTKVQISGIEPALRESSETYVSNEIRPNSRVNLFIYNTFNTKKGRYKTKNIRNVGEAPHLLDSAMVDLSANQIRRFLFTKGYFQAKVNPEITVNQKKARINFQVEEGIPYQVRNIDRKFDDDQVKALFEREVLGKTAVKPNTQYDAAKLLEERERLYTSMRNNGYYDYLRQYMRAGIDSAVEGNQIDLKINVENPSDSTIHKRYQIDSVYMTIRNYGTLSKKVPRRIEDSAKRLLFVDETNSFRWKPLERYMYLRSGHFYSLAEENKSYDRLYEMNGFRSVKIQYVKKDSNKLDVHYDFIPRPRMGNQIEGEYTFSSGMSGFNIGNTFSQRNIFGGSEQLEVKLRYGVLFDPRLAGGLSSKIFNNDFQVGVNLVIPRLMVPFPINPGGKFGLPKTTYSMTLQLFDQDRTYSNRYFITSLNYSWYETENKYHSFTPIVLEYRDGRLDSNFRKNLEQEGYQLYVRSNDRQYFGLGTQYNFVLNGKKLTSKEDFHYFRGTVDVSGNVLDLISSLAKLPANADGEKEIFGVPFLQYAKTELDYRLYRNLGGNRQFVFRFNPGIAIPYGNNSKLLIFEKSFYSGGMNGIRAWQARTLGPGSYNRENLSEDLRLNLRNLDQLGEIKLEANAEYRFRLLNNFLGAKMNGATFVDMGNVWRIKKDEELNPGGEFKFNKFLGQVAIGTGFGLRFDSDYFVIRLDAGLKIKDPQFSGSDQWVIKHFFDSKEFKQQYYESHRPDRYNFIQYNFGIGMPF
ncbi:BamA/TamA family outer membrane protein [Sphingobacterium sp. N143]|uniref:translocation and assembly module lipoprotein TamL n=1 Tax=Sphingobacterium sp. N143 TaxID=2746727 RepID=UPI002577AAD1|nr:BamA/TamA family outer membrane protein [Sphingobacterium sp. N143]MDM1295126.1 BamA/TamA family outer membrane protein [Sphingobacterium sp. N143]